jgi:hypothetical protein
MIIWSGWGICVPIFAFIALIIGIEVGDLLMAQFAMAYGPAQSAGIVVGGGLATIALVALTRWREHREGTETRTFIDERTGERFDVRPNGGSFFFIPIRFWGWIMLALTAFFSYALFDASATP